MLAAEPSSVGVPREQMSAAAVRAAKASAAAVAAAGPKPVPAAFRPSRAAFKRGGWLRPEKSRRQLADLRKRTILAGGVWEHDRPLRPVVEVRRKGHKHERGRAEREAKIAKAMEEMPARVEEYRKKRAARRVNTETWSHLLRDKE